MSTPHLVRSHFKNIDIQFWNEILQKDLKWLMGLHLKRKTFIKIFILMFLTFKLNLTISFFFYWQNLNSLLLKLVSKILNFYPKIVSKFQYFLGITWGSEVQMSSHDMYSDMMASEKEDLIEIAKRYHREKDNNEQLSRISSGKYAKFAKVHIMVGWKDVNSNIICFA